MLFCVIEVTIFSRTKIYKLFTLNLIWKHIYGSSNISKKKFNEWYVVIIPFLKLLKNIKVRDIFVIERFSWPTCKLHSAAINNMANS